VGVLENLRGAAGDGLASMQRTGQPRHELRNSETPRRKSDGVSGCLDFLVRLQPSDKRGIIMCKDNISTCYDNLKMYESALSMKRETYAAWLRLDGPRNENTIRAAMNVAIVLARRVENFPEAKVFLREVVPRVKKALGPDNIYTLQLRLVQGEILFKVPGATLDNYLEAESIFEDVAKQYTGTFGATHPKTECARCSLATCRQLLQIRRAEVELASDFTGLSPEEQVQLPELAKGLAAGISCPNTKKRFEDLLRATQQGGAAKTPSIKEMKVTIKKAGLGVADLFEKPDVVARYGEALARLAENS